MARAVANVAVTLANSAGTIYGQGCTWSVSNPSLTWSGSTSTLPTGPGPSEVDTFAVSEPGDYTAPCFAGAQHMSLSFTAPWRSRSRRELAIRRFTPRRGNLLWCAGVSRSPPMLVVVILVVAAVIVAAVVLGKKSNEASYIIFPCRVCHSPQQVAVAETMRRVQEAHAKGQLAELGKHKISCMKCGAVQTSDWLMHPKTRSLINELDAGVYRDQTTTEYMKLVAADSPGAPGLDAAASAPAQSPVAAPPVKPG